MCRSWPRWHGNGNGEGVRAGIGEKGVRFEKFGRSHQPQIRTAADLEAVLSLDQSLWAATSAPRGAFRCDARFLECVDHNGDGRIHSEEVRVAVRWMLDRLSDRSRIAEEAEELALSALQAGTEEGKALLEGARHVLRKAGRPDADAVALEQVRAFLARLQSQPLNGDGIIVPASARDEKTAQYVRDAVACTGGVADASGVAGIGEEQVSAFQTEISAFLAWQEKASVPAGSDRTDLMPLGDATPGAYALYQAHAAKVDAFFTLARMLRFEPGSAPQLTGPGPDTQTLSRIRPETVRAYLESAPLAQPQADGRLPLAGEAVNPHYREWLGAVRERVLVPLLGGATETLTEDAWERVKRDLAGYGAYLREKKGPSVEQLPHERLSSYRSGEIARVVQELIARDRKVTRIRDRVRDLEQLLLYHQHLLRFVNNFVSFPELYAARSRALFEAGSAVMDGRWFNFALRVDDVAAHSMVARASNIFVLYLEVTGPAGERFLVAVPATSGTKGNLDVGKRGIFFDVDEREYGVKVLQIIENPISLREALCAPFVRLWRYATGKIETWSSQAEKKLQTQLDQSQAAVAQPAAPRAPGGSAAMPIMGVSVAAAALSSAFAFITKTLSGLQWYQIVLGLVGAAAVVMLPAMLVAILKLRSQDLSSLLEGCGWAVNVRMRLDRSQRRYFTRRAPYPEGAQGTPREHWKWLLLIVLLIGLALILVL